MSRQSTEESRLFKAIVYPEKRKIGCVLQQAIVGGDRSLCHLFHEWEVGSFDGAKAMKGTRDEWQKVANHWNRYHAKKEPKAKARA